MSSSERKIIWGIAKLQIKTVIVIVDCEIVCPFFFIVSMKVIENSGEKKLLQKK